MSQQQLTTMLSHLYSNMTDEVILAFEERKAAAALVQDLIGPRGGEVFDATLRCIGSTVLGELLRRSVQQGIPEASIPHTMAVLREHGIPASISAYHSAAQAGQLHLMSAALYSCSMLLGLEAQNASSSMWAQAQALQLPHIGTQCLSASLHQLVPLLRGSDGSPTALEADAAALAGLLPPGTHSSVQDWTASLQSTMHQNVHHDGNGYTLRDIPPAFGATPPHGSIWTEVDYTTAWKQQGTRDALTRDWLKLLAGGTNVLFACAMQSSMRQPLATAGAVPVVLALATLGRHRDSLGVFDDTYKDTVASWWNGLEATVAQEFSTSARLAPTLLALLGESDPTGGACKALHDANAVMQLLHAGEVGAGLRGDKKLPFRMLDARMSTTVASALSAFLKLGRRDGTPEDQAPSSGMLSSCMDIASTLVQSTSPFSHAAAAALLAEAAASPAPADQAVDILGPMVAHLVKDSFSKALDSVTRLLNPHAPQVQEVSMACACAAVHDLAVYLGQQQLQADSGESKLPSLDSDTVLGYASLQLQSADVTWGEVSPLHQLLSDRMVEALLDVLGNSTRAGTAAAGTAALRQVLRLRAQYLTGEQPVVGRPESAGAAAESGAASAFLAVYLPAGTQPLAWAGSSNGKVCTDVFATSDSVLEAAQGKEHAVGLPLAVTAQTFTQWVVDVDEDVDGMTPIQPVGGTMRKNAAGVMAKVAARQAAGGGTGGSGGLQGGDTSYEAAAALLSLGHNKAGDLLDNGAFIAAQVDALSSRDPVLQLCAVRFLRDAAAHSDATRSHMRGVGLPVKCVQAANGQDAVCQRYASELLASCEAR